jgi:hypothetical protein
MQSGGTDPSGLSVEPVSKDLNLLAFFLDSGETGEENQRSFFSRLLSHSSESVTALAYISKMHILPPIAEFFQLQHSIIECNLFLRGQTQFF